MKEHPEPESGGFSLEFTYQSSQNLWEEITESLNSIPNGAQQGKEALAKNSWPAIFTIFNILDKECFLIKDDKILRKISKKM